MHNYVGLSTVVRLLSDCAEVRRKVQELADSCTKVKESVYLLLNRLLYPSLLQIQKHAVSTLLIGLIPYSGISQPLVSYTEDWELRMGCLEYIKSGELRENGRISVVVTL
jgi:hypothetical protein